MAFHSHFNRLLDVEKWWGLNCVSFTASDLTRPRSEQECWHRLQEALDVPVEVHLAASRLPSEARITLQEVIMQWHGSDAASALQRAVRDLEGLQLFTFRCDMSLDGSGASPDLERNAHDTEALLWRIGREFSPLVTRYLAALLSYVKQNEYDAPFALDGKLGAGRLLSLKRETVRQLNNLDQQRAAMRAKFSSAARVSALGEPEAHEAVAGPQFRP
jgi:hypothetical protein